MESGTCPVCYCAYTDPVVMLCGHSFCRNCLARWTSHGHNECPVCRQPLPPQSRWIRNFALQTESSGPEQPSSAARSTSPTVPSSAAAAPASVTRQLATAAATATLLIAPRVLPPASAPPEATTTNTTNTPPADTPRDCAIRDCAQGCGLSRVCEILSVWSHDAFVLSCACARVRAICDAQSGRQEVARSQAVKLILQAMRTHGGHSGLVHAACQAIAACASHGATNDTDLKLEHAGLAVGTVLSNFVTDAQVSLAALHALHNLSANEELVGEVQCELTVIRATQLHDMNVDLVAHSCGVLANIAQTQAGRQRVISAQGADAIQVCMLKHRTNDFVLQQCCYALQNLSRDRDAATVLANKSLITQLNMCLKKPSLREDAASALANMAHSPVAMTEMRGSHLGMYSESAKQNAGSVALKVLVGLLSLGHL
eukprot:TRINITY_DN7588_c0_g1_i2.p1 TRINITY_DN7588_c0_g1~~TRINITY_DN7588_c0_g1_i2.p1  ORF type:complete len:429 (-),score=70.22 TRINITY_DN7588_c0_g1_i2:430-1716(-)